MSNAMLVVIFVVAAVGGYFIIRNVPALLHTPLMSGMNALSGITVLGAMVSAGTGKEDMTIIFGIAAAFFAMLNVSGGFAVTDRMLSMFSKKEGR